MTSVYHLDRPDLCMTRYCAAQNQSRLNQSQPVRSCVDITNLLKREVGHVSGVERRFLSGDRLRITFKFEAAGKSSWGKQI